MRIEPGAKTDEPIRTRGWTYWHHLFNPRQLLVSVLINKHSSTIGKFALGRVVNFLSPTDFVVGEASVQTIG